MKKVAFTEDTSTEFTNQSGGKTLTVEDIQQNMWPKMLSCAVVVPTASVGSTPKIEFKTKPRRQVRFSGESETHESNFQDRTECRQLWYSPAELERFKKDNIIFAKLMRDATVTGHASWFLLFEDVYNDLCRSSGDDAYYLSIPRPAHVEAFNVACLGLEQIVLKSLLCDRKRRRDALYHQVDFWQEMAMQDQTNHDKMIGKISYELSRPSCTMSLFVARVVALSVADDLEEE